MPWLLVAATVVLTVYGQIVLKWQVGLRPHGQADQIVDLHQLLMRPWVVSAFVAAFAASLCWMLAISRLELSRAYPFMALNFVLVSVIAVPLFGESFGWGKAIGLLLVVAGLSVLGSSNG